ncbi:hypothetical protein ABZ023_19870 [Streptomyces sp. NPDC006367]|uniref:hypothetical protein n=1 Tax=Streptomyces sp. NPDC006367 TaxID=3156759 RepID=UPI0033AA5314
MRSARTLLTTAAASAVLVLGAPGAYADGGDWNHEDSSYSKEQDHGGKHDGPRGGMHTGGGALTVANEGDWGGSGGDEGGRSRGGDEGDRSRGGDERERPRGGMHTGGGALTVANEGDWGGSGGDEGGRSRGGDEGGRSQGGDEGDRSRGGDEGDRSRGGDERERPHGGMHTGGGGLSQSGTTAGGLAVLAVAATGLYAVRRRKSAQGTV